MPTNLQRSREAGWLFALFALYLLGAFLFERKAQQATRIETPSSFNARASGVKAYYLLLEKQNVRVGHLLAPWSALSPNDGMLVVAEPLDKRRDIEDAEVEALKRWVEAGGSVLYFVAPPSRDLDALQAVVGNVAVVSGEDGAKNAAPEKSDSPYLQNVVSLSYRSSLRLRTTERAHYQTLVKDSDGALLLHKALGKGHLIISAMGDIVSNDSIKNSDNVVLLANLAAVTAGEQSVVEFDEYHHGVGFGASENSSAEGVWAITPLPLRLICYGLLALGLLLLYNGNLWFGPLRRPSLPEFRASADYVGSVAGLLHRARAADVAITSLYTHFMRDLRRNLDIAPDIGPEAVAVAAQRRYAVSGPQLQNCLIRSAAAAQGQRISETEMMELAQQLEFFRRACHLV